MTDRTPPPEVGVTPDLAYCDHGYSETEHCRTCEIMGVCKRCLDAVLAAKVAAIKARETAE